MVMRNGVTAVLALLLASCGGSDTTDQERDAAASAASAPDVAHATSTEQPVDPDLQTPPQNAQVNSKGDAMIAAANPLAVDAGLDVLARGGSAVDAAIAVQAVLGLVEPESSGLGGGAFLLHYDADTRVISAYDGRERAPAAATPELFLDDAGQPISWINAKHSGLSIGTPGAVDMLAMAHGDHGELEWSGLFSEGARLARDGFPIAPKLAQTLEGYGRFGAADEPWIGPYLYPDGQPLTEGQIVTNPDYAETLEAIAGNPRALLEGPIAQEIVDVTQAEPRGGSLTLDDLANYRARRAEPICLPYGDGLIVCGMPSPSSGGVAVAQILGIVERLGFEDGGAANFENWRRFIEAQRLSYADRDRYFGDQDYVEVPVPGMLAGEYLDARAALVNENSAIANIAPGDPWAYQDGRSEAGEDATAENPGTSHLVVVAPNGDVVSMTTTIEGAFGSLRMAGGFFLNNELTDFSFAPMDAEGQPIANRVEGGKRPRSSMSPTIVLDSDGEFVFATGSPGGSTIIAHVAKSLVGVLDWGLSPQQAAELPIIYARGDVVRIEGARAPDGLVEQLRDWGFQVETGGRLGSGLHSVLVDQNGALIGAADPRRDGVARGLSAPE